VVCIKEAFVVEALEMEVLDSTWQWARCLRVRPLTCHKPYFIYSAEIYSALDVSRFAVLYVFTRWVIILCES
jgi:hypothetical protein